MECTRRLNTKYSFRKIVALIFLVSISENEYKPVEHTYNQTSLIIFSIYSRAIILPRIFRVINLVRTIRILRHREHFKTSSRHLVGQNKKRTIGNGFDLDLCCISGMFISTLLFQSYLPITTIFHI